MLSPDFLQLCAAIDGLLCNDLSQRISIPQTANYGCLVGSLHWKSGANKYRYIIWNTFKSFVFTLIQIICIYSNIMSLQDDTIIRSMFFNSILFQFNSPLKLSILRQTTCPSQPTWTVQLNTQMMKQNCCTTVQALHNLGNLACPKPDETMKKLDTRLAVSRNLNRSICQAFLCPVF